MSISDILYSYDKTRSQNENIYNEKIANLSESCPGMGAILDEINLLFLKKLENVLYSKENENLKIDERLNKLLLEKTSLLNKLSLGNDYLDPVYTCARCKDTGYCDYEKTVRCSCFLQKLLDEKLLDKNISFAGFDEDIFPELPLKTGHTQREHAVFIKNNLLKYTNEYPNVSKRIIILRGDVGLGKTYLLKAGANALIERGFDVAFTLSAAMFEDFYAHRLGRNYDLSLYFDSKILFIDDLGTEPFTKNVTVEYFYNLINSRLENGLTTFIATNLSKQQQKDIYGERTLSRISSKDISLNFLLEGDDLRLK